VLDSQTPVVKDIRTREIRIACQRHN
jgi:hypothetical protein